MRSRRRRMIANVLVVLFGTTVALAMGEIVLRVFWPQRSPVTIGMFRPDPDAGFRLQGNYRNEVRTPEFRAAIRTDAEGYRVPEGKEPPPAVAGRILVVGDSFTFRVGVDAEDAFPELCEKGLAAAGAGPWAVRNGGVGGYGPLRSSRLLLHRQASWMPHILIHAFYLGNDLEDPQPDSFLRIPEIRHGRMFSPGRPRLTKLRLFLRTRSHLYAFLRERLYGFYRRSGLSRRGQYLERVGLAEWPPRIRNVGWPAGQEAMIAMRDWAREHGAHYLVVLVPAKYHVEDQSWELYRADWRLPQSAFDRDHGRRVVGDFLGRIGVPVLDLTGPFRSAAAGGARLYYQVDRHWTPEGHELAAECLARELISLGWSSSEASASTKGTNSASADASR